MITFRFERFLAVGFLALTQCSSRADLQEVSNRQDELDERLGSIEAVQANLVNQVAEIESSTHSVALPLPNLSRGLPSVSQWQEQQEREKIKRDLEGVKLQQQVDEAQRNAERAFGKTDR